jgi:hypothetical protein
MVSSSDRLVEMVNDNFVFAMISVFWPGLLMLDLRCIVASLRHADSWKG